MLTFHNVPVMPIALSVVAIILTGIVAWFIRPVTVQILDKKEWKSFPLVHKEALSHNTALYRFGLPSKDAVLGLPIGQHISVQAEIDGKQIMRSYTPTTCDDDKGHFDLVVKTYEKGNISLFLSKLKVGQTVRIRGPKGQMTYSPNLVHHLGMIAGGTGITPCLQIIQAALKNSADNTEIDLIYANVTEDDILLKSTLTELAAQHPKRFRIYHVLNNPPEKWSGGSGFVTKQMIEDRFPPAEKLGKVLMCGPPPMLTAMKKHLADLNYPTPKTISKMDDQIFCF